MNSSMEAITDKIMLNNLTTLVLIGTLVALIIYDVAVFFFSGVKATISETIYKASKDHPIIAFAIGVLMGHFFWPV